MEYLYTITVAFFLTVAAIPLLIRFSAQLGMVDDPSAARKMHSQVMPRTGGVGIIVGAAIPLIYLMSSGTYIAGLLPGCCVIVLFGLLDDRYELSYQWKLLGQGLAAILAMAGGIVFHQLPFFGFDNTPAWLSYPVTFLFLVGVVNGVNFSDGLDGLAGGTSIMALLVILILALQAGDAATGLTAIAFIGGIVGFLRYNTYPARIFMGDAGSQFIGFLIACLAIVVTQAEDRAYSALLPLLLLGIPILDIIQVIPVRLYKGLPLPGPDNEHFHHQLVKLGFRHYEVVTVIYLLQSFLMAAAYLLRYYSDLDIAVFYAVFLVATCSLIYFGNKAGWQFRAKHRQHKPEERRNRLLRRANWLYRYLAKIVAATMVLFMVFSLAIIPDFSRQFSAVLLLMAVALGISSAMMKKYYAPLARLSCCAISILLAYQLSQTPLSVGQEAMVSGVMIFLMLFLLLSIRMTRKDDFVLDTQDLLILLAVLLLPQLPFETLTIYSVSRMAITTFILLYAVEFLINTGRGSVMLVNHAAIITLAIIGGKGLL